MNTNSYRCRTRCSRSNATKNGGNAIVRAEARVFGGPSHHIAPDSCNAPTSGSITSRPRRRSTLSQCKLTRNAHHRPEPDPPEHHQRRSRLVRRSLRRRRPGDYGQRKQPDPTTPAERGPATGSSAVQKFQLRPQRRCASPDSAEQQRYLGTASGPNPWQRSPSYRRSRNSLNAASREDPLADVRAAGRRRSSNSVVRLGPRPGTLSEPSFVSRASSCVS